MTLEESDRKKKCFLEKSWIGQEGHSSINKVERKIMLGFAWHKRKRCVLVRPHRPDDAKYLEAEFSTM
jgi:hypothetical protein